MEEYPAPFMAHVLLFIAFDLFLKISNIDHVYCLFKGYYKVLSIINMFIPVWDHIYIICFFLI